MDHDDCLRRPTNLKRHSKGELKLLKQKKRKYSSDSTDSSTENSSSDSDTFTSNEDSPCNLKCSCCNIDFEENEILYDCRTCSRKYHLYCHIPFITASYEKKIRQCKLCEDMDTISKDLGKYEDAENLNIGTVGRNIAERILMELYCSEDNSGDFRDQRYVNNFPSYYRNTVYPFGLNDLRNCLQTYGHYYKLSHFMNDTKLVLANNISYFDIGNPSFDNVRKLLTLLKTLYNKWVAPSIRE